MPAYRVDRAAVLDLLERLRRAEAQFDGCLDGAEAAVRRLHGEWSGLAADEQLAAHQRWTAGAREMHEALRALALTVSATQDRYAAVQSANLAMWR